MSGEKQLEEIKAALVKATEEKWRTQEMLAQSLVKIDRLKRKLSLAAVTFKKLHRAFEQIEAWDESEESAGVARAAQGLIVGALKKMRGRKYEGEEASSSEENQQSNR